MIDRSIIEYNDSDDNPFAWSADPNKIAAARNRVCKTTKSIHWNRLRKVMRTAIRALVWSIKIFLVKVFSVRIGSHYKAKSLRRFGGELYFLINLVDVLIEQKVSVSRFYPGGRVLRKIVVSGRVAYKGRRALLASSYNSSRYFLRVNRLPKLLYQEPENSGSIIELEEAIILLNPFCDNYYHWNIEVMPMLTSPATLSSSMPIVIAGVEMPFHMSSLNFLERSRVVFSGENHVNVAKAYFPDLPYHFDNIVSLNESALSIYRSNILTKLGRSRGQKRIFVDRRRAKSRRLVNSEKVYQFLNSFGFERVDCEELSFEEQVSLFSNAEMVVAVHGAAISNIIFAPPSCGLIELFPEGRSWLTRHQFFQLSQYVGIKHVVVGCAVVNIDEDIFLSKKDMLSAMSLFSEFNGLCEADNSW